MKINIQNIERDLTEINEEVDINFLPEELSSFYPGTAQVHVIQDKFGSDNRFKIDANVKARYVCDRCLETYEANRVSQINQIIHVGAPPAGADEDIVYLDYGTKEIDLSPVLKEMLILQHPIKMLCKEDCKGLCPRCGVNLNKENCRCITDPIDPRWEKLQKLIK